MIILIIQ